MTPVIQGRNNRCPYFPASLATGRAANEERTMSQDTFRDAVKKLFDDEPADNDEDALEKTIPELFGPREDD